jgi:hypothetical protein
MEFKNDDGIFVVSKEDEVPAEVRARPYMGKWQELRDYVKGNMTEAGDIVKIVCPTKKIAIALRSTASNWAGKRSDEKRRIFPVNTKVRTFTQSVNGSVEGPHYVWFELQERE